MERGDGAAQGARLLERLLDFRVFADAAGRMNLSLRDVRGGLLLVPQFTLAADTSSGHRPGFSTAAAPELAQQLFEQLVAAARAAHPYVATGAVWRPHAGVPDQRRSGHFLAASEPESVNSAAESAVRGYGWG